MSAAQRRIPLSAVIAFVVAAGFSFAGLITLTFGKFEAMGMLFACAIGCTAGGITAYRSAKKTLKKPIQPETQAQPMAEYRAPTPSRVHLPERDEWETGYLEDGSGTIEINVPVFLHYRDTKGQESSRRITVKKLVPWNGEMAILAFCHERQAHRTFKLSGIMDMYEESGQRIENPADFLMKCYNESPLGICRNAMDGSADQLLVLSFIARAKGRMNPKDKAAIVDYLQVKSTQPLDQSIANREIGIIQCDLPEFRKATKRLVSINDGEKERLFAAAKAMVYAAKSPDPMQIAALQTAGKALRLKTTPPDPTSTNAP